MSAYSEDRQGRGFRPVLENGPFRALWLAQLLAQISQNAINFIQMVLVEKITGSAVQLGITILMFTLPGVIFSPIAGVIVDRFPRKWILVGSNLSRVFLALSYLVIVERLTGTWELLAIYAVTFVSSTVAQFFAPAEAATIPSLVGEEHLMTANSLFTLTMAMSQVVGLVILGPLAVSLLTLEGGFILIALLYLGATISVSLIPSDQATAIHDRDHAAALSGWQQLWSDMREGLHFVSGRRRIQSAMTQLTTVATVVMILAMLVPGYAARVLGLQPENAAIVFAPAGVGMLLATGLTSRWGHLLRRWWVAPIALVMVGLAFAGMGWISQDYQRLMRPILRVYPHAAFSLTTMTMALSLVLGMCLATVNILAQTSLQQDSPPYIRGRVFALLFMMSNLVGIPPMLGLGSIADSVGIPRVMVVVGLGTVVMAWITVLVARLPVRNQGASSGPAPP
jgi:MFS family permease